MTEMCPMDNPGAEFNPVFHSSIFAELALARASTPIFYSEKSGFWIVTRYEDCVKILHSGDEISSANATERVTPAHPDAIKILQDSNVTAEPVQANCDTARHAQLRKMTMQVLNVRNFAALEPGIRELVVAALDTLKGRTTADLLTDVFYDLPAQVLFLLLGIPDSDIASVKKWAGHRATIDFCPATYDQQIEGAKNMAAYWVYCRDFVAERVKNPRDDFASKMLALRDGDDARMTLNELTSIFYNLLFAGHETTTTQLTNVFSALLRERDSWQALCDDPTLVNGAIEEGFRCFGAVVGWRRRTTQSVTIGDVTIPAKANILLSFGSANRDETMFDDPDRFDITRKNARRHLTMGNGKHACLGAPLARIELKVMLEEMTKRFPQMRLQEGLVNYVESFVFQAPTALLVDLK